MFGEPLSDASEAFLEHTFAYLARSKGNVFEALTADEPPPESPTRAQVEALRSAFAAGGRKSYRPGDEIVVVAALLKSFFRAMPEPLLTYSLHGTFIAAVSSGHGYDDVRRALRALPDSHARVLGRLTEFLGNVASLHPAPDDGRRALGGAFAGLLSRDVSPTLEGVLADAAFIVELLALLMRERDLFKGTAGNADEDAAFIKRMENSYKRLRVNMAAAYRRERAELRQNHSEAEVSKMMQRRADKVRTGTLDSTAMAMFERMVGAEQKSASSTNDDDNENGDRRLSHDDDDDDDEIHIDESSSSSEIYEEEEEEESSESDDDDGKAKEDADEGDFGTVPTFSDRPRRVQSERSPRLSPLAAHSRGVRGSSNLKTSAKIRHSTRAASRRSSLGPIDAREKSSSKSKSAKLDREWSDEDSSEDAAVTRIAEHKPSSSRNSSLRREKKKDRPDHAAPASPGTLATAASTAASAKAKEKKEKMKLAREKRAAKARKKKKIKIRKKSTDKDDSSRASASPSKRRAQKVRIIAAHTTATPGKLSYKVGDEALIVQKMSSTWAKARIGDRIGLIRLADVKEIEDDDDNEDYEDANDEPAIPPEPVPSLSIGLVRSSSNPGSPNSVRNRSRSSSGAVDQNAIAIERYDAATHERAKKDYLRRRARSSGRGLDELASRGSADSFLSTPLFFEKDARIHLLSAPADRPWWQGELDGKIGCFQAKSVKLLSEFEEDEEDDESSAESDESDESSTPLPPPSDPKNNSDVDSERAASAPTVADAQPVINTADRRSFTKPTRPALADTLGIASQSSPSLAHMKNTSTAPKDPRAMLSQSMGGARRPSVDSTITQSSVSVPSSPRDSPTSDSTALESETVESVATVFESLHKRSSDLIAAVEAFVANLPKEQCDSTEFECVALALRQTQAYLNQHTPIQYSEQLAAQVASPSTPQQARQTARSPPPSAPAALDFRRRMSENPNGSADTTARKIKFNDALPLSLQIGAPQVVPASPKLLRESPSRNRRSASVASGGPAMAIADPKKATRIGSFLSKFSSKGNEAPTGMHLRPTFGVPLRDLVESVIDIPEFVLRGGERLAKYALQEDVLLLGDVDEEQVMTLRHLIESGARIDYAEFRAHDITATLAQFIAELPEPLVGRLSECAQCAQIDDAEYRDALFQSLLAVHKPWHRALLEFLLVLQHRFSKGFETNTLENFVNVFAGALWQVSTPGKLNEARKLLTYMCQRREALFGGGDGERLLDNDDGVPILSAATVDRLIVRLLDANYAAVDPTFANVFFLTHDYVLTPDKLVERLINSYLRCAPPGSGTTKHVDMWRVTVCSRVLLVLHFWLTTNAASHVLADRGLMLRIREFAKPLVGTPTASYFDEDTQSALTFLKSLAESPSDLRNSKSEVAPSGENSSPSGSKIKRKKKKDKSDNDADDSSTTSTADPLPVVPVSAPLCQRCNLAVGELKLATGRWTEPLCRPCGGAVHEVMNLKMQFLPAANWQVFSTKDIADTITQIDFTMLRAIRPQELLHKAFSEPKRSPNFAAMTSSFNRYSQWVATEILKCDKANQRAECIVRILKVAQQLRRCYNFHAFFAFVSGLSFSSVTRLHRTWAKVPKKYRERFERFQQSMSMDSNFGAYQKEVSEALADGYTIIPLLVLLSKRLTAVEENNPTYLNDEGDSSKPRLVNCSKLRMLYKQVDEVILSNQSEISNDVVGQGIPELRLFFLNLKVMEESELHQISRALEHK